MRTGLIALGAAGGETLVAWKEQDQLRWQIYGRDGRPEGGAPNSTPSAGKGAAGVMDGDRFILFQ